MAKQIIENLESASVVRSKINSNFTDLYDNKAPLSHTSSSGSTYGVATSTLFGHVRVTSGNGLNLVAGTISMTSASTTTKGTVQLNDTLESTSDTMALTASQGKTLKDLIDGKAPTNHASNTTIYGIATDTLFGHIKVTSGNGLSLIDGTLSLNVATTSSVGAVQLNNTLNSTSTAQALTAAQGKILYDTKAQAFYGSSTPSSSTGKNGDIYFLI